MLRLEKFSEDKIYMFPNGDLATPEKIKAQFPAVEHFVHVLEVNGDICQAVMNLSALRNIHKIDNALTEEDAILEIETIINAPIPEPEPTAQERIASALEFQNLLNM